MKPKLLRISGLNSFVEEQTIDFSRLIEKGLFGIFGPTGSGKSTILDAMTIALYGHITRGTKEFINTETDKLYVSYEFEIGGTEGRKSYRVERSIKKNDNGGINTDFARLSFLDDENNVTKIIDKVTEINEEITKIIGLNHNDFTRSVVLPQGKFSDFLKLSGSDRRNMLERILGLEKYGGKLIDRIRIAKKKEEDRLRTLNGELNRFEGVEEENIKSLKSQLEDILKEEKKLKEEILGIERKYERLSRVWDFQQELSKYIEMEKKLSLQEKAIKAKKDKCTKGKNARNAKPYLDRYDDTLKDIEVNKKLLDKTINTIKDLKLNIDKTEEKYKAAFERKEKDLPLLIEREAQIKHAIELKRDMEKLKSEREQLLEQFDKYRLTIDKAQINIENIQRNKVQYSEEIEKTEAIINKIKISPEYRNKLTKALELEKKFENLTKDSKEKTEYIKKLKKNIFENRDELEKILKNLEHKGKKLSDVNNKLRQLENNAPNDTESILNQEIELQQLKTKLSTAKENKEKKENINKEIDTIVKNRKENELKLDYLNNDLEANGKELENVKKELKELERIYRASIFAAELIEGEPCPVCGSHDHPNRAKPIQEDTIEKIEEIKSGLEQRRRELEKEISKLVVEIKRDLEEEEKKKKELNTYIVKLGDINIDKMEKSLEIKAKEIEKAKADLKSWQNENKETKILFEEIKDRKAALENQKVRFEETLKKDNERLKEETDSLGQIREELETISRLYKDAKKDLKLENIESKLAEVRKNDEEQVRLENKLKKLRSEVKLLDYDREKLDKQLNEARVEIGKIEEAAKEKKQIIQEYKDKIYKIIKDRDPEVYLEETNKYKAQILGEEEKLRKKIEEERKELNKLQEKKVGLENTNKTLENSLNNIDSELDRVLQENNFKNIEEAKKSLISLEEIQALEVEIEKYDDEMKKIRNNITTLRKKLKGESIEEKEWIKLKEARKNKAEKYNSLLEEIGKKKEKIHEMEKNFNSVKELVKKIKKVEYKVDMLNDMFKLVSGNKFVEFVAVSHLRYIAREASKRLMDITNKRYSLELDSKGNFIICDNYNGGVRRDCNTLSGGETFMTSLSLALALSTQIQLKGNASIEFFFLDEGFGTLDNGLLDMVMNSLEKLHQEKLSVGIISHVEELKNRVPIKLIVEPAQAGLYGTRVGIERN
ncbi:MAG: repair protein SbcC/Rad50 [Candidatus Petromonas sp.]|nr:repair protein SbcC/Rad50 [Candidatus Petromonas sp.]